MAIYFIQAGTNGPIKIGYTDNDIQNRISQLQTGCPYELKLIWLYTGTVYEESEIHEMFEHEKVRGEWFHPAKEIFKFIYRELKNPTEEIGSIGYFGPEAYLDNIHVVDHGEHGIYIMPKHPELKKITLIIDSDYENIEFRDNVYKQLTDWDLL